MTENEVAPIVVDAAFKVHITLGPGLLESVYESVIAFELQRRNLRVERQVPLPVKYEGIEIEQGFRMDLVVEGILVIEVKSVDAVAPVHRKQLLTYLRLSGLRLGLLVNFNTPYIKDGITRIVNGLPDSK